MVCRGFPPGVGGTGRSKAGNLYGPTDGTEPVTGRYASRIEAWGDSVGIGQRGRLTWFMAAPVATARFDGQGSTHTIVCRRWTLTPPGYFFRDGSCARCRLQPARETRTGSCVFLEPVTEKAGRVTQSVSPRYFTLRLWRRDGGRSVSEIERLEPGDGMSTHPPLQCVDSASRWSRVQGWTELRRSRVTAP